MTLKLENDSYTHGTEPFLSANINTLTRPSAITSTSISAPLWHKLELVQQWWLIISNAVGQVYWFGRGYQSMI